MKCSATLAGMEGDPYCLCVFLTVHAGDVGGVEDDRRHETGIVCRHI